jgi:peptidoglycan/LPS O-acetylase OafA/YrhL
MSTAILSAPTSSLRRSTIVVGAVGAAATTLAAATMRAAGVHLAVHGSIPLAAFAQLTFVGAVLGGLLVAVLNRRSAVPRRRFIQIALGLTALSCLAPAAGGDDIASKIGLIAIHLLAGAIIAPVLARQTTR